MNQKDKFLGFLDKVTTSTTLVESIREAFLLLESEDEKYECKIEFNASDREGSLQKLLEMYNGTIAGIFVLDQENSPVPPTVAISNSNPPHGNRTHRIEYDISADGTSSIIIRASDKYRLEKVRDSIKSLLEYLGKLGNGGHSFEIRFYPNSTHGKMKMFGWDGDGADRIDIDSIKITKL